MALKPYEQRKATAEQIIARLRPKLARVAGVTLLLQAVQDVRLGGRSSRTQYQYTLEGAHLDELQQWAPRVLEQLKKLPQLRDVASDQQTAGLEIAVVVDRDTAGRLGVTTQAIDDTLYDAFGQRQVATSFTAQNYYRVVLEVPPARQAGPDALDHLYVRATQRGARAAGGPGTLRDQADAAVHPPSRTVSGHHAVVQPAPGTALGQAVVAIERPSSSSGCPSRIHAGFKGTAQAFGASLDSEPWLILAALFTVYVVLGILYESLIHPITILSTLPSAALGALIALYLMHVELSIIALIGVILLLGIVKKNAIMMIDFALEAERREDLEPAEAIRRACLLRFRPILMTTIAALFGALPLAIGLGAGLGAAAAARSHHRRGAVRFAVAQSVLDAGHLCRARPPTCRTPAARCNRGADGDRVLRRGKRAPGPGLDGGTRRVSDQRGQSRTCRMTRLKARARRRIPSSICARPTNEKQSRSAVGRSSVGSALNWLPGSKLTPS